MNNILIGNGLSIMVHSGFNYTSLYEKILKTNIISNEVQSLFKILETYDFELIIDLIEKTKIYCDTYKFTEVCNAAEKSISEIKELLIKAVTLANPNFPDDALLNTKTLNTSLLQYNKVFTTNYDLLLYWSCRNSDTWNIRDGFSAKGFDVKNDRIDNKCMIYFLHGAIHLYEKDGNVHKISANRTKGADGILTNVISQNIRSGILPVFIAEGISRQKLARILSNKYLTHCYNSLKAMDGVLDVFGHSLKSGVDDHLLVAINHSNVTRINLYYYNYRKNKSDGDVEAARVKTKTGKDVFVFDSKDHQFSKNWCVFDELE